MAAKRDRRRSDIAAFLDAVKTLGVPPGNAGEQAIWVIFARHGTKEGATRACAALWQHFLSINEFRVAKVTEIADVIERHVKNDPIVVAEQARGFLRKFFTEFQMVDFASTEERNPSELKRYLTSLEDHGREIALALALHYCAHEFNEQALHDAPDPEAKPKKRPEKDITASANRLRLLFCYATHSTVTAKEANVARTFLRAWAYKALPAPKAQAKKVAKKIAKKVAKAPAKKAAKKTAAKKTAKKAAGKTRPRTTRTTRTRAATKKSSRR